MTAIQQSLREREAYLETEAIRPNLSMFPDIAARWERWKAESENDGLFYSVNTENQQPPRNVELP
jgi:hypothetical protein